MRPTDTPNKHALGRAPTRACPLCAGATLRTARSLADRVLSLLMPVKRYRCCAPGCGWEGLLLARLRRRAPRARAEAPLLAGSAALADGAQHLPPVMAFRARLP